MIPNTNSIKLFDNPIENWIGIKRSSLIKMTFLLSMCVLFFKMCLILLKIHLRHFEYQNDLDLILDWFYEPTLITYSLLSWIFIFIPLVQKVLISLRPIMSDYDQNDCIIIIQNQGQKHKGIYMAIICGTAGMLLFNIKKFFFADHPENIIVSLIMDFILFFVIGCLLFTVINDMKLISKTVKQTTSNIFDPHPFQPVARWSLAVSLVIVGGIIINQLFRFESGKLGMDFRHSLVYFVLLVFAILVFRIGMWQTHLVMNQNKKSENKDICDQLIRIHHDIKSHAKKGQFQKADTLLSLASKLYTHQKMIEKTPDWPYTNRNMGSLFISILIPVIIGIIQKYI